MSRKSRRSLQATPGTPAALATQDATASPSLLKQDVATLARQHTAALLLALITLLAYLPSFRGMYNWDDGVWLTQNDAVLQWSGLPTIWLQPGHNMHFYPMTYTTFWLEHKLWGLGALDAAGVLRPYGYHFTNTALHITSALLLFALLKKLKLPGSDFSAWLAAAIFALHPVNVESVAWIAERKNTLSQVFFFASLIYALRFFNIARDSQPTRARRDYALALTLFTLALLSKTTTCILPVIILILLWWRDGRVRLRQLLQLTPFFLLALIQGFITMRFEQEAGALGPEWFFSWPQRIVIAARAFWFYLAELAWPHPILQVYPRWPYDATDPLHRLLPASPLDLAYPLAALALFAALFLLRKRISRGPLAALLCFLVALAPALGFLPYYTQLYTFVADHYQYLAAPAAIVLAVETALLLLAKLRRQPSPALAFSPRAAAFSSVILLPLAAITLVEGHRYSDDAAIWRHTLDYNPTSWVAWNNLASCTVNRGDFPAAIDAYQHAIALRPNDWRAYEGLRDLYMVQFDWQTAAHYDDLARARIPQAVLDMRQKWAEFRIKLQADHPAPAEPPISAAHAAGRRLLQQDKYDAALAQYQLALRESPRDYRLPFEIANVYVFKDAYEDALKWYAQALDLNPSHAESWFMMGLSLKQLHRDAAAAKALNEAWKIDPLLAKKKFTQLRPPETTRPASSPAPIR